MKLYQLTWQGDFELTSKRPVSAHRARPLGVTAVICAFVMLVVWYVTLSAGNWGLGVLSFALALAAFAWWQLRGGLEVSLEGRTIHVKRRGFLRARDCADEAGAYKGLKLTTTRYFKVLSTWTSSGALPSLEDAVVQRIELVHPARKWTVPVYQHVGETIPRAKWEKYAARFDLPLLIEDGDRLIARAPEDLDKNLKQLAEEDKLEGPTTAGPPPWSFRVRTSAELIHITIRRPAVGWLWVSIAAALPGLFLLGALMPSSQVDFMSGVVMVSMFSAPVLYLALIRHQISIFRDRLEYALKLPFLKARPRGAIRLAGIEQVSVLKISGDRRASLLLADDKGTLAVARGVRKSHLEWLRDFITGAVVTA